MSSSIETLSRNLFRVQCLVFRVQCSVFNYTYWPQANIVKVSETLWQLNNLYSAAKYALDLNSFKLRKIKKKKKEKSKKEKRKRKKKRKILPQKSVFKLRKNIEKVKKKKEKGKRNKQKKLQISVLDIETQITISYSQFHSSWIR